MDYPIVLETSACIECMARLLRRLQGWDLGYNFGLAAIINANGEMGAGYSGVSRAKV
jgi:hypothetical protein